MDTSRQIPTFPPPDKRRRMSAYEGKVTFAATKTFAAKAADPHITSIVANVDSTRLAASVNTLAQFKTRHSLSSKNVEAAKWLRDQFLALEYTDVILHDFSISGVTRHNVVCTKKGTTASSNLIIVGAHYDSRMSALADSTSPAPGSDDNGSGTAALLEIARVLKSVDTASSIQLVAFSGEEQGLVGSAAYADHVNAQGLSIRLMINLDMIGHPEDTGNPTIIVEQDEGNANSSNDAASQAAAQEMASAAQTYTSLKTEFGPIIDSDYMPFEHFGYVCIGAFDGADHLPFYHSTTDTPDKVNTAFHTEVVRMVIATILGLPST